jgi:DNA-binding transcriptional MerR regulator
VSHSIGEVLNRLKDEFEDITISKIRFLEAEGLINPDRTESGYRKFADGDIDRLRYVLRAQRDRYLPLKVIKDELDRIDHGLPLETPGTTPDADDVTTIQGDDHIPVVQTSLMASPTTDVALTTAELSEAVGLDVAVLQELVSNGVLPNTPTFDAADLRTARIVADLLHGGLEPRHLRMFTQFADRQVSLLEQLIAPLLRQRNPQSRTEASDRIERLGERGAQLHRELLGRRLRAILRP